MPSDYKKLYATYVLREIMFLTFNPEEKNVKLPDISTMISSKYLSTEYAQDDTQEILEWLDCK